jgi:GDP-D-mannose dehydratase
VAVNLRYFPPAEVETLLGDPYNPRGVRLGLTEAMTWYETFLKTV